MQKQKMKYALEKARKNGIICTEICKNSMNMYIKTNEFMHSYILMCKKYA